MRHKFSSYYSRKLKLKSFFPAFTSTVIFVLIIGFQTSFAQLVNYTSATSGALNSVATNVTGTALSRVNGASAPSSSCSTGFSSIGFTGTSTFSTSLPAIEVTLTPNAGYSLTVTSFSAALRRSSTGPSSVRFAYSTDGGTTWVNQGSNKSPKNASCGSTTTASWTQSVTVTSPSKLKFRVYGFHSGSTSGVLQILNLVISGTTSAACSSPSGLAASNITSSSATLAWGSISSALSYNIQYRKTGTTAWTSVNSVTNSIGVSGLLSSTNYDFQVQTVCSGGGTSAFSSSGTFTTSGTTTTSVCDSSLWNHVYHSYRLIVNQQCTTVTGTVDHLIYEADGDIHIRLNVDSDYKGMLNSYNNNDQYGDLVLEPVCATTVTQSDAIASCQNFTNTVYIPNVGEYVSVVGSFVTDNDHGWNEIHPVTSITIIPHRNAANEITSDHANRITVFPNPASSLVNFHLSELPAAPVLISIVDQLGRNAGQYQLLETNTLKINTTFLPAGIYYFNAVENGKVIHSGNFVVTNTGRRVQ